jgi:hypothetical protein
VIVLVDSGSSHSFINDKWTVLLARISSMQRSIKQVANGQVIRCSSELKQARWSIQGYEFATDLKILPLPYYDLIIGLDWLEVHSPMKIDWLHKWMVINLNGEEVHLHGFQPSVPAHSLVAVFSVSDDTPQLCSVQSHIPEPV